MLRARLRGYAVAWFFLAPALLLFTYFKFIPMARAIEMSFYEVRPFLGDRWVGGANYETVVTSDDVLAALGHTLVFAVLGTFGSIVLGLLLALLLEGTARHLWFIRTVVFLPTVAAGAVVAEVWRILYYPAPEGTVNSVLAWVGLGPSQFLNASDSALPSILAVIVWHGAPYNMMIFLAGLAGVDRSLYEAAAADGASIPRRIWHITLPALRPVFAILFTLAALRGLRIFTEVYLLTNGGPDSSTETLMTLIYKLGLERNELGVAAAGSVLLLLATAVLTLAVQAARRREATS
ncbi:carbohydrate ABC transporter permease [Phytohabitans rumicis]|uniref:Sugar ABC transporter permease n=1 Tax=Phytohabitans rumicis TaxID=1076125 RepID=A0A6V8LPI8_9ACTN|nr:sugar ABC transporter permease [Phytohabitans rumicis]GFJ96146.1 sugar ABC transporter permease [Phytohabitans rumicis]